MTRDEIIAYAHNAWGWISGTVNGWPTYTLDEITALTDAALSVARPDGVSIEIGTFSGKSLSCLLGAARAVRETTEFAIPGPRVVSIDLWGWDPELCLPHLRRVLADFADVAWRQYPTDTETALRWLTRPPGDIWLTEGSLDFLHVDGEHSEEAVVADCSAFLPYMRSGGLVAFHDANPDPRAEAGVAVCRGAERMTAGWETVYRSLEGNCLMIRRKP
jgi:MMP 1-O-methyltransferase